MKSIFIVLISMCWTFALYGEAQYYYSDSHRIPLYKNTSKAIIRTSKGNQSAINKVASITPVKKFICEDYDLTVIEKKETSSLEDLQMVTTADTSKYIVYPCYKNMNGEDVIPTSYIYVELKDTSDINILNRVAAKVGCQVLKHNRFMPLWYTLCLKEEAEKDAVETANMIMETNYFNNSCPAFEVKSTISYDPLVLNQWGLYNSEFEDNDISVSEAWNYSTGSGVIVAVIDSGIDLTHEDLADNILPLSYDAYSGTSPSKLYPGADLSHGTHCAGIIGAVRNNNLGLSGVAPDAKLMSISVQYDSPDMEAQLADGINWAYQNGADILSCSWVTEENPMIKLAINNALQKGRGHKGCIIVFSVGNGWAGSPVRFPANYSDNTIAVGFIEKNGVWDFFSCKGEKVFVCAPGRNILSTVVDNSYEEMSGASMACPHVAGVAALMLELNPGLSIAEVQEIMAKSTKKVGHRPYNTMKKYGTWNELHGYGLIDACQAVKITRNKK